MHSAQNFGAKDFVTTASFGTGVILFVPRDRNMEMGTKEVPVRAVELSIGAFCIEFRCEQLCDYDMCFDRGQISEFS